MRLLIAVKSCLRDRDKGCHDAIRNSWGCEVQDELRFFVGESIKFTAGADDEISLDVADDYDSLPHKTRAILRWSIALGYDFTFLCDNDTFVIPKKLKTCGYQDYDVSGLFKRTVRGGYRDARGVYPDLYPWPSGGYGYFLSRKAAEVIVAQEPTVWAEDMYVGQCLGPKMKEGEITGANLQDLPENITWHFPNTYGVPYKPELGWMQGMQKKEDHNDRHTSIGRTR